MQHTNLHTVLKERGHRITKARSFLLHLFFNAESPMSAVEIGTRLKQMGVVPNKTTVYRELEFLMAEQLIQELNFNQTTKYYELKSGHHHHVICKQCGRVEEVELEELEATLPVVELKLKRMTQFKQIDHSLEFFGICSSCHLIA